MPVSQSYLDLCKEALKAYTDMAGNKSRAAEALGLARSTFRDRLEYAFAHFGIEGGSIAEGKTKADSIDSINLPRKGQVNYFYTTYAQNNTPVHPGFQNMIALVEWLAGLPNTSQARLLVSTGLYNKKAFGLNQVDKNAPEIDEEDENWYAPEVRPYICDDNLELAPAMIYNGRSNIIPTRKNPLSNKDDLHGRMSNIIPHTKMALRSVPAMLEEHPKINVSTGACTQMNYVQVDAGYVAEQQHKFGGLLLAVYPNGSWFPMHLELGPEGEILWHGPDGYGAIRVENGEVHAVRVEDMTPDQSVVEAINWGDTHAVEMDQWVREACFQGGGITDQVMPAKQFHNDVYSHRNRSHHDVKSPYSMFAKHVAKEDSVEDELVFTAEVINEGCRPYIETIIVQGNHDRHLDQWVAEQNWQTDPVNAITLTKCTLAKLTAMQNQDSNFSLLEWALNEFATMDPTVRFLNGDESYVICRRDRANPGIECGLHGDRGSNGSRGSTVGLKKLGRKINKGHDHTATIDGDVFSAGALAKHFGYQAGPSTHTVSHIITYKNGTRSLAIMFDGRWR